MAQNSFDQALSEALGEMDRLQARATELVQELELNQVEIAHYEEVVMALKKVLGVTTEPENADSVFRLQYRPTHERSGRGSDAPTQTDRIVTYLSNFPQGLKRADLEHFVESEGLVSDAQDKRAAINTALWRAVKTEKVEKAGDLYRVPLRGKKLGVRGNARGTRSPGASAQYTSSRGASGPSRGASDTARGRDA